MTTTNPDQTETASTFNHTLARIAVGAYDDAQDVRTSMMNRVRDLIRKRNEDIPFDEVEGAKDADEREYDSKYADENLPELIAQMHAQDKLTEREFEYLQQMLEAADFAAKTEQRYQDIMKITTAEPIYTEWLTNVYGVSHTLTARLIHRFGYCGDFDRVSNLWSYAGFTPGSDRSKGEQLGYDPDAKTLGWLVADRMVMGGDASRYRTAFYDPYKATQVQRMEDSRCTYCGNPTTDHVNAPKAHEKSGYFCTDEYEQSVTLSNFTLGDDHPDNATPPWSQGHANNRAMRYLAKKFLKHYWAIAREIQGMDVPDEWVLTHGGHEKRTDTFENPFYAKRALSD